MPIIPEHIGPRNDNGPVDPAEASTLRIRRLFNGELSSARTTAERIRRSVESVGRAAVDADLGSDAADLVAAYVALKAFILVLDPDAEVPDLPVG